MEQWEYLEIDVKADDLETSSRLNAEGWEVVSGEERVRTIPNASPRLVYDPAQGKSVWLPSPTERYYHFILRRRRT